MSSTQFYVAVSVPFFTLLIIFAVSIISNRTAINALRAEMRAGFDDLRSEMRAGFAAQSKRMDGIETRMDRIEGKLDRLIEEVFKLHEGRLSRLEERVFGRTA